MTSIRNRAVQGLITALIAASAGCSSEQGIESEQIGKVSSPTSLATILGDIVQNGAFTNVYVFPTPSTETWEAHMASLRTDAANFSRASIDAVSDRMMDPAFPSYFGGLFQYHCGFSTDCGINPPQFFGSGVASQACVDAALKDKDSLGVLTWPTVR